MAGQEEVANIGVKLTVDGTDLKRGLGQAQTQINEYQRQAQQAGAGVKKSQAGGGAASSSPGSTGTNVNVSLTVSRSQLAALRREIQAGLGVIPVTIQPVFATTGRYSLQNVMGAAIAMQYGVSHKQGREAVNKAVEQALGSLPRKAMGGPVSGGRPVIVGERRAEVFVPRSSGYIHPDAERYYRREQQLARWHQREMDQIHRGRGGPTSRYPFANIDNIIQREARLGRDFAGPPAAGVPPAWLFQQIGPQGKAGMIWNNMMRGPEGAYQVPKAMRAYVSRFIPPSSDTAMLPPMPAIPWMQGRQMTEEVARMMTLGRYLPRRPRPMQSGGQARVLNTLRELREMYRQVPPAGAQFPSSQSSAGLYFGTGRAGDIMSFRKTTVDRYASSEAPELEWLAAHEYAHHLRRHIKNQGIMARARLFGFETLGMPRVSKYAQSDAGRRRSYWRDSDRDEAFAEFFALRATDTGRRMPEAWLPSDQRMARLLGRYAMSGGGRATFEELPGRSARFRPAGGGRLSAQQYFSLPTSDRLITPVEQAAYERHIAALERLTPDQLGRGNAWYPLNQAIHRMLGVENRNAPQVAGLGTEQRLRRLLNASGAMSPQARYPNEVLGVEGLLQGLTPAQIKKLYGLLGKRTLVGEQALLGLVEASGRKVFDYTGSSMAAVMMGRQPLRSKGAIGEGFYATDAWQLRELLARWDIDNETPVTDYEFWASRTGGLRAAHDVAGKYGASFQQQAGIWTGIRERYLSEGVFGASPRQSDFTHERIARARFEDLLRRVGKTHPEVLRYWGYDPKTGLYLGRMHGGRALPRRDGGGRTFTWMARTAEAPIRKRSRWTAKDLKEAREALIARGMDPEVVNKLTFTSPDGGYVNLGMTQTEFDSFNWRAQSAKTMPTEAPAGWWEAGQAELEAQALPSLPPRTLRGLSSLSAFGPWDDTPLDDVTDMKVGHYLQEMRGIADRPTIEKLYRGRKRRASDWRSGDNYVVDEITEPLNIRGGFETLEEARAEAERLNADRAALWRKTHAAAIENVALLEAEVSRRGLEGDWHEWSNQLGMSAEDEREWELQAQRVAEYEDADYAKWVDQLDPFRRGVKRKIYPGDVREITRRYGSRIGKPLEWDSQGAGWQLVYYENGKPVVLAAGKRTQSQAEVLREHLLGIRATGDIGDMAPDEMEAVVPEREKLEAAWAEENKKLGESPASTPAGVQPEYPPYFTEWKAVKNKPKGKRLAWVPDAEDGTPGWILYSRTGGGPYQPGNFDIDTNFKTIPVEGARDREVAFTTREEAEEAGASRWGIEHGYELGPKTKAKLAGTGRSPFEAGDIDSPIVGQLPGGLNVHENGMVSNPSREATIIPGPPPIEAPVPQHEAPPVIEHAAIAERNLERRAQRMAATPPSAPPEPPISYTAQGWPPSAEEVFARERALTERRLREELAKRAEKLGLFTIRAGRRAAGGEVGPYIVNELGRELFVPDRLSHLVPRSVRSQIPGMFEIDQPPYSMFSPPENGWIIPAHLKNRVPRAQAGLTPEQDRFQAREPLIAGPSVASPGPVLTPAGASPGPILELTGSMQKLTGAAIQAASALSDMPRAIQAGAQEAPKLITSGMAAELGDATETMADAFRASGLDPDMVRASVAASSRANEVLSSERKMGLLQASEDWQRMVTPAAIGEAGLGVRGKAYRRGAVNPNMVGPGLPPPTVLPTGEEPIILGGRDWLTTALPPRTGPYDAWQAALGMNRPARQEAGPQPGTRRGSPGAGPATQAAGRAREPEDRSNWVSYMGLRIKPELESDVKDLLAAGMTPEEINSSWLSGMTELEPLYTDRMSPETQRGIRFAAAQIVQQRKRQRAEEGFGQDPLVSEARQRLAGTAGYIAERNPKGMAAVVSGLFFGGGEEFRRRQAIFQEERIAYTKASRAAEASAFEVKSLELALKSGAVPAKQVAIVEETLAEKRKTLRMEEEAADKQAAKMLRAEEDARPTMMDTARNFTAIVAGTSLYSAAMASLGVVMQATAPAMEKLADQFLGFAPTATRVTKALAEQTRQQGGNYQAVVASSAAMAGMSASTGDWVTKALESATLAKAGAKAYGEASDLFRAAMGAQAGQGLYGGYGGVFGSPLLAEQLGGGKGLLEQIIGDIMASRGQTGLEKYAAMAVAGTGVGLAGSAMTGGLSIPAGLAVGGLSAATSAAWDIMTGQFGRPTLGPQGPGETLMEDTLKSAMARAAERNSESAYKIAYLGQEAADAYRDANLPQKAKYLGEAGYAFVNEAGGIVETFEEVNAALEQLAEGLTIPDVNTWSRTVERALNAQFQMLDIQSMINRELTIPLQYAMQRIQTPLLAPTTGVLPPGMQPSQIGQPATMAFGGGKVTYGGGLGLSPEVAQMAQGWVQEATDWQKQVAIQDQAKIEEAVKAIMAQPAGAVVEQQATPAKPSAILSPKERSRISAFNRVNLPEGVVYGLTPPTRPTPATGPTKPAGDGGAYPLQYPLQGTQGAVNAALYRGYMANAKAASDELRTLQETLGGLQATAARASWANTTRLALRQISDAAGVLAGAAGKAAGGSALGRLEGQLYKIGRASQSLNLALQQRQITTQLALAQFQAPGETGEERYYRQRQAIAEAGIAKQQLGYAQQTFTKSGQAWQIQAQRNLEDAQAAWDAASKAHDAEAATALAQGKIAKLNTQIAENLAKAEDIYGTANTKIGATMKVAGDYVSTFGGTVKKAIPGMEDFGTTLGSSAKGVRSFLEAMGFAFTKNRRGPGYTVTEPTWAGETHQAGILGVTTGATGMIVGEAGPETVAVLRNPRIGSVAGGSSPTSIQININGPVVRSETDITSLARAVAVEVERSLSRKGQMLGLRGPAV